MRSNKEIIYNYHEQTKHRPHRYARSLGYLDWDNEPNPFRKFTGTEQTRFPFPSSNLSPPFHEVLFQPEHIIPHPIHLETLSQLFLYSLGISAWKEYQGARWAVRCNPSSGNLHPTEGYLITPPQLLENNHAILFHYDPEEHLLEKRAIMTSKNWNKQGLQSYAQYPHFFIALTSIIWREAWKYGERAFRYCLLDTGHAIASLVFSSASLGWDIRCVKITLPHLTLSLGLNRSEYDHVEKEFPQILLMVSPHNKKIKQFPSYEIKEPITFDEWYGTPEKISPNTIDWNAINEVSSALINSSERLFSQKLDLDSISKNKLTNPSNLSDLPPSPPAFTLFQQRRSAHAFDIDTSLKKDPFFNLLKGTHFLSINFLKNIIPSAPHTSLLLFLHHVENLKPGIYTYIQNQKHIQKLVPSFFEKLNKIETPDNLPFFLCLDGNMRKITKYLCCDQEIAHDGVLCACIFTDLKEELQSNSDFSYITLHWEAGFIGQLLYLEAEIYNLRGTGIGCFFDDEIITIAKQKNIYQTPINPLYYFTIGKPIIDKRLKTHPPYNLKQ